MNVGKTLFAQVMEYIPWTSFARIVDRYAGNSGVRRMTCAEQFRIMAFAQLTWRESLRDIEVTLGANVGKLYAMGLRHAVHRSTLADANETRDWRIWSDFAAVLIRRARKLYCDDDLGLDSTNTVYALDSTTIDLCLSLFDWAPFRSTKAAVKLHTLLDLRGNIPAFIHISDGKMGDVNMLFKWRRQLQAGLFDAPECPQTMLPVAIIEVAAPVSPKAEMKRQVGTAVAPTASAEIARHGTIEIQIDGAMVRFDGQADMAALRAVVKMLRT